MDNLTTEEAKIEETKTEEVKVDDFNVDKELSKHSISKIASRAGIMRINNDIYAEFRNIMMARMKEIIRAVLIFTEYNKRKTVTEEDILSASEQLNNILVLGINKKSKNTKNLKKCKTLETTKSENAEKLKPGKLSVKKIKFYQKESDNLLFPKENFKRIVKSISNEYNFLPEGENIRYQKNILPLLQMWIEEYMVKICSYANMICLNTKRQTLFTEDLKLALKINSNM
jgi:histone H3/H4